MNNYYQLINEKQYAFQRTLREYMKNIDSIYEDGVYKKVFANVIDVDDFDRIVGGAFQEWESTIIEIDLQTRENQDSIQNVIRYIYETLDWWREEAARQREIVVWCAKKVDESAIEFAKKEEESRSKPEDNKREKTRRLQNMEQEKGSAKKEYRPKIKYSNKRNPQIKNVVNYDLEEKSLFREEITANRSFWRKHGFEI